MTGSKTQYPCNKEFLKDKEFEEHWIQFKLLSEMNYSDAH